MNVAQKKQKLADELRDIERQEREAAEKKRREDNYAKFLKRPADWVIGRAHCEHRFKDRGWHNSHGEQLPASVQVNGNMGHTYYPTAWITGATNTYFHNVWTHQQREAFQKKLNALVQAEISEIMNQPYQAIEIMGLQSEHYLLKNDYPESKIASIKKEIAKEQAAVLDKYTDEQLLGLPRLSHGERILLDYLKANRKELFTKRKKQIDAWWA